MPLGYGQRRSKRYRRSVPVSSTATSQTVLRPLTTPLLFAPYKDAMTTDCRPVAAGHSPPLLRPMSRPQPQTKDQGGCGACPARVGHSAGVQVMGIGLTLHVAVWRYAHLLLKLDLKNSFNLVNRAAIMEAARLRHGLSSCVRTGETESRPRSPIFIVDTRGRLTQAPFDSVEGAQQGSEYGAKGHNRVPECFNAVNAFLQPHGGVLRADCDDCVIAAPPAVVGEAFERLVTAIEACGGTVQPTKSKAYATPEVKAMMADEGLSLPDGVEWGTNADADGTESSGLVVAGTPVGEPQFILNYVTSVVQDVLATITTVTDKLLSASANDHALQCMRLSFRNRVNFLQQVVVPTPAVLAQYQRLDDALDDATARIMGLDLLRLPGTPAARGLADPVVVAQRARLPARLRGTGHRSMVDVALAAFIGSMAMVIPRMPDRTDDNRDTIVGLFSHLVAVTGTGEDFQRKYEGSRRFSTFFRQADAIGIEMGTGLREAWGRTPKVGDPARGSSRLGLGFAGPAERRPLSRVWI